jgi:glutamate-1-semialdehyde 2,1-aminomutase
MPPAHPATAAPSRTEALFEEASRYIPGGTSRVHYFFPPHPLYAHSGQGCRLTDVDGVTRLDFVNNMTSLIHGHGHPAILSALMAQLPRGVAWSEPGEEEVRLARHLVERVPSIERIRFGNSGTESVMLAVKLARAFTGRHRIAKFEGFYHGYYDYVQTSVKSAPGAWGPLEAPVTTPNSGGLSPEVLGEVLTIPFNEPEILASLLRQQGDQIAALLVDPLASQAGSPIPDPGFLARVTELANLHGIVLIYDEVVSFRLGYAGGQERYGGHPDLTVLGKIMGGGLPVGAVGGRADLMALLDPTRGAPTVLSGGTTSANPLSMVAGLAAMEHFTPAAVARLNALGERMRRGMDGVFARHGTALRAGGDGSLVRVLPMPERPRGYRAFASAPRAAARMAALHEGLLREGIITTRMGTACLSTPMGEAEVDAYVAALDRVVPTLPQ